MPNVSNEFIAHAQRLAEGTKQTIEKSSAQTQTLKTTAEMVADTLINNGLVPEGQKQAAVTALLDHEQCLQALNKTANVVTKKADAKTQDQPATSMGSAVGPEKRAASDMRESDRTLLRRLNFNV